MTARVLLHPSMHAFDVEGHDTVLEAGLKAGYRLEYGCSGGNCGDCKARLVTGEIEQVRPTDFRLSEAEKNAGVFLMCSSTPKGNIEVETFEAEDASAIREQEITARIRKIDDAEDGTLILNLKTPRTERLRFLAGQHARLSLGTGGEMGPEAMVPMASCPCDDMRIQFHLNPSSGDPFTRHLVENRTTLDQALIRGPYGDFILDDETENPLIFIAADTGFAPVRSLIEHAMSLENAEAIHLIRFTSPNVTPYMQNLVRSWEDAFDRFHHSLHPLDADGNMAETLASALAEHAPLLTACARPPVAYVAAPLPYLDDTESVLKEALPGTTYYAYRLGEA